jgi:predicted ATP-dependent serine protease
VTLVAGRPKVGKSTALFALMAALTTGEVFLNRPTRQCGVLLLTEERADTIGEKARSFEMNEALVHLMMRYESHTRPWRDVMREAIKYAHRHDLKVLIVDTLDKWAGLTGDQENSAGAVTTILEPLLYAAASGLAVIPTTHQRKSAGQHGEAVRGSNALVGAVDIILELERLPGSMEANTETRLLRAESRFSSTPEELVIELTDDGYEARGDKTGFRRENDCARVLEAAEAAGAAGATDVELVEATDLSRTTVRRRANELTIGGQLRREGKGGKADPHRWIVVSSPTS